MAYNRRQRSSSGALLKIAGSKDIVTLATLATMSPELGQSKDAESTEFGIIEHLLFGWRRRIARIDCNQNHYMLMHHGIPKICDSSQGILCPLTQKMQDVCPKEVLNKDLLGIGCVLYSISTWEVFNYDFYETGCWPVSNDLKPTVDVMYGTVIENCWHRKYSTTEDFYNDITRVETK